jgi:protein TonB
VGDDEHRTIVKASCYVLDFNIISGIPMFSRIGAITLLSLFIALPNAVIAQTSSVSLHEERAAGGATLATPMKPLEILDTDYPLESLLANEHGSLTLHVVINVEGQVIAVTNLKSSGSSDLDHAAAQVAIKRWRFAPGTRGGQAVASSRDVDVTWALPLRRADELYSEMMGFPVEGKVFELPQPTPGSHRITARDYPRLSIEQGEIGTVVVRALVLEDGTVGQVDKIESSGWPRLDNAAASTVKSRFRYKPGTVDGVPARMGMTIQMTYQLGSNAPNAQRRHLCYAQPAIGLDIRMGSNATADKFPVNEWLHLIADGSIDDIVLLTDQGWMHLSPSIVQSISLASHRTPSMATTNPVPATPGPEKHPDYCWYEGERELLRK